MKTKPTWVAVADAANARLLRLDAAAGRLEEIEEEQHWQSRAKAGELLTDRQGRSFDFQPRRRPPRRGAAHRPQGTRAAGVSRAARHGAGAGGSGRTVPGAGAGGRADHAGGELRAALLGKAAASVRDEIGKDLAGAPACTSCGSGCSRCCRRARRQPSARGGGGRCGQQGRADATVRLERQPDSSSPGRSGSSSRRTRNGSSRTGSTRRGRWSACAVRTPTRSCPCSAAPTGRARTTSCAASCSSTRRCATPGPPG